MTGTTRVMGVVAAALMVLLSGSAAWASQPLDTQLTNFLDFQVDEVDDQGRVWGSIPADQKLEAEFDEFSRHFGQLIAPRVIAPSQTLGQAGFAVKTIGTISVIPNDSALRDGVSGDLSSALFTGHVQVRKGLPFSVEVSGNLGYLPDSTEMFMMGADVRWAIHEGLGDFVPDAAVRMSANTVTGAPELVLFNVAGDFSLSWSFGIGGVMNLTPYGGLQQLHTFSSTRKLNAYPQDPRPPVTRPDDGLQFAPEAVFSHRRDNYRQMTHRLFLGARLNVWIVSLTMEGVFSNPIHQFSIAGGVDF